jgi:NAD(P)-dependent dehydrogenase (short-subunit alcohol dehydrogenase family)
MIPLSALLASAALAAGLGLGCAPAEDRGASASPAAQADRADDRRVAFITGSTGGLGREVARVLGSEGWHVIVHGRNAEAGEALVAEIEAGPGSARFFAADLASNDEARALGDQVLAAYPRLDVVIANAGIWLDPSDGRQVNEAGVELHFQVNYLAHYLLSRMLIPRLVETAAAHGEARIIQVASTAQSAIEFDDVMLARGNAHTRGYGQSKLAQILLAKDLAAELEGTGVLSVSLHPATLMGTGMVLDRGIEPRATVEEGVEAVLQLVRAPGLTGGLYFRGLEPVDPNPQAFDLEAREQLRLLSGELTGVGNSGS